MEDKRFTLEITCYGKYLAGIENADENEIRSFIENHNEPLPESLIYKRLSEFKNGYEPARTQYCSVLFGIVRYCSCCSWLKSYLLPLRSPRLCERSS